MKTAAIHIGAHKTASTLVQQVLEGVTGELEEHGVSFQTFGYTLGSYLMQRCSKTGRCLASELDEFEDHLAKLIDGSSADHLILSSEGLSGSPTTGWSNAEAIAADVEDLLLGRGLVESVSVVLCTRRHDTWIESLYQQEVLQGRDIGFDDFLSEVGRIDPESLRWSRLVQVYEDAFGSGAVSVVRYEVISEQGASSFVNEVLAALGARIQINPVDLPLANPGLSPAGLDMARRLLSVMQRGSPAYWETRGYIQQHYARMPGERVELLTPERRAAIVDYYTRNGPHSFDAD